MISLSKRGTTWNRYAPLIDQWSSFCCTHGQPWLPIDHLWFARFLAEAGAKSHSWVQTKMRVLAAKAFSTLAGAPFDGNHPLIQGYREGIRRLPRARKPPTLPIFGYEIPHTGTPDGLPSAPPHIRGHGSRTLKSPLMIQALAW